MSGEVRLHRVSCIFAGMAGRDKDGFHMCALPGKNISRVIPDDETFLQIYVEFRSGSTKKTSLRFPASAYNSIFLYNAVRMMGTIINSIYARAAPPKTIRQRYVDRL